MTTGLEHLERELVHDLEALPERFADEEWCGDLYRALAGNVWSKEGGPAGHVSFSRTRAEQLVNELRTRLAGADPLPLAQTGGEGEVSRLAADELTRLGWTGRELNTSREDRDHVAAADMPPSRETEPPEWERQAHEEADRPQPGSKGNPPSGGAKAFR